MIAEEFEGFSIDDIRAAERDIIMRYLRNNDRNYKVVAAKLQDKRVWPMTNDEIYRKAIETYSTQPQIDMAVEEMAELTDALMKFKRGRRTVDDIVEEIADVTIMMRQMAIIFGLESVETMISFKTQRLKNRLEEKQ